MTGLATGIGHPASDQVRAGWLQSLRTLYVLPEEFRTDDTDWTTALRMLGCGEQLLRELMAAGLRHTPGPDGPLFDWHDLHNLALYSGSGSSQPERGMRFALRWMGAAPETWTEPVSWRFEAELSCPHPHSGTYDWSLAEPIPALYGGESQVVTTDAVEVRDGYLTASGIEAFHHTAELRTAGISDRIRSPELREILLSYSSPDYRWLRLPHALQVKTDLVLSQHGVTCVASSLDLAARCRAAGYPARTRIGWMLGLLDLRHAWIEVTDDDGVVKVADPVFGRLADLTDDVQPGFREACLGSTFTRLLPTALEADTPLTSHRCGAAVVEPVRNLRLRMREPAGGA